MSLRINLDSVWVTALLLLVLLHHNGSSFGFSIVQRRHHTSAGAGAGARASLLTPVSPIRIQSLLVVKKISRVSARAAESRGHGGDFVGDDVGEKPRQSSSTQQQQHHETLSSLSEKLDKKIAQNGDDDQPAAADGSDNIDIVRLRRVSLVRTRLDDLQLNRTMLGPSTIAGAGRGLFAVCDSKEGDLLTCYPGDALVTILNDDDDENGTSKGGESGGVEYNVVWGNHVHREDQPAVVLDQHLQEYLLHAQDDYGVLGLPSLDEDPAYLGHFVNDGGRLLSQNGFTDYILDSFDKANAKHRDVQDGSHMVLIATRDITKGEEIFVTYGPDYWMEQPCFVDDGGSIDGDLEDE
jgi:hypothetical protein